MSGDDDRDLLPRVRSADPAHSSPVPSESKARVWARIQEVRMQDSRSTGGRRNAWALGAATLGAIAVLAVALLINTNPAGPGDSGGPGDAGGPAMGSCVETYSPETLPNREFAFDGTVAAIEGDNVTFSINKVYKGQADLLTRLKAPGMTGTSVSSAGGPNLSVGERYLVAGDGDFVWACGFTQPYDAAVAAEWERAIAS